MRQRLAWLSTAPLMLGGLLAGAHCSATGSRIPDAHARADALAHSGHGYFGYMPFALAVSLGVLLAALALQGAGGLPRREAPAATSPLILVLPPIAFVVQEFVERLVHTGHVPWTIDRSARVPVRARASSCRSRWPRCCSRGRSTRPLARSGRRWPLRLSRPFSFSFPIPCASVAVPRPAGLARGYGERAPPSFADRRLAAPRGPERRSVLKRSSIALAIVLIALAAAPSAFAHAILQKSTPENGSVVRSSPATVSLRFNEAVETAFGSIRVYDCGGGRVDSGKISRPNQESVAVIRSTEETRQRGPTRSRGG